MTPLRKPSRPVPAAGHRAHAPDEDGAAAPWYAPFTEHGVPVLLLLVAAITIFLLFPTPRPPDAAVLERGAVAPEDVIAEFPFNIPKPADQLMREQAEAASGVPPIYNQVPTAADSMLSAVTAFFDGVDSVVANTPREERAGAVRAYMTARRISPTASSVEVLLSRSGRAELQRSISGAVKALFPRGVAPSSLGPEVAAVRVRRPDGAERLVPSDSLLTPDRFYTLAADRLPGSSPDQVELQHLLLIRFFQPSLVFDEGATEAARARARAAVDPVAARVLRGEKVVGAHEQIGDREAARLKAYEAELVRRGVTARAAHRTPERAIGAILFNLLVLGIFGAFLLLFRRPLYRDRRAMVLFTVLVVSVMAVGAVIARFDLPPELIPVTFASLIVAVLWEGRVGLLLALVLALLIAGQTPFLGVTAPFTAALGGAAAAFSVRMVQRRSRTWLFISIISLAYVAAVVAISLLRSRPLDEMTISASYGIANAVVASLVALGFLPLLETLTGVITDQTLLELSDTNRPLLRRLQQEANGTFHHTINVANLAEAACHAIGANGLLARVGAYYHDVGKLAKPQYFIENQPRGRNPHDKLKPSMSCNIIRGHVAEGLKLAEAERLPHAIRQFIPEHHGTQQIAYFFNRAKEQNPEGTVNEADYCYGGPKPQTKEAAVLMLADSVESASHVLQDPTPSRIREMVERIVSQKMDEGQLDEAPLTLREITIVEETLTSVLSGMYHHRIDYPTGAVPAAKGAAPSGATGGVRA